MVTQTLREGFAEAHRHPGLIFLDVIWKLAWLALTLSGLLIVIYQFVSHFEWTPSSFRALDAVTISGAVRQMWNDYGGEFLGGLIAVAGMSAVLYVLLEARVRRKLVVTGFSPRVEPKRGLKPATTSSMVFVGSSLAKLTILAATASMLVLMVNGSRDAAIAAFVVFAGLAFLLTIIDTLVRTDAVELLGADLLGVTGLIGTLVLFEWLIAASLLIVLIAGFLSVSSGSEALGMLAVTSLVLFILIFLHSYLLVVRFSAVGIMRRNVIDV
jgi:hypothetical protein